ncbi:MAG: hypothetical protein JNM00_07095 [Flavobacteriales bacterium]|nr:hypothetical protein [Flavobacteriales bacterium]
MALHTKIYLSDEGFGHIVRQRAVVEALRKFLPDIQITIQTRTHLETARKFIPGANYISRYNNISWQKEANGTPDVNAIREHFRNYDQRAENFINEEVPAFDADFCISDFVCEAFEVAQQKKVPAFGVAHFTWDWFFSKLYPLPVSSDTLYRMMNQAASARKLFFPPFTPPEIMRHYNRNAIQVPLILKKDIDHKVTNHGGKFKILIMDSGAGVIRSSIEKAIAELGHLDDMVFYVAGTFSSNHANVVNIPEQDLMVDYVRDMDLVIGRAGFNTISECIGLRTPMLLLGEAMNPEINENILMLKQQHLASFISLHTFENELSRFLPVFLTHEYKQIRQSMNEHTIDSNGAEVIASHIASVL